MTQDNNEKKANIGPLIRTPKNKSVAEEFKSNVLTSAFTC